MEDKEIKSIVEAILFSWGDPLELKDIASILEIDPKDLEKIIDEMMDEFDYNLRGLKIIKMNKSYQMVTRPEHYIWIKKLSVGSKRKSLSNAALETLSIIAYRQPIIKSEIEAIRGVRCDRSIATLMEKGLVEELGRLEKIGRPIIYGTTDSFLRSFGLENLEELRPLGEYEEDLDEEESAIEENIEDNIDNEEKE